MNIKAITVPIARTFKTIAVRAKRFSPEILIGVGTIAVVGGTIMACVATTKVSETTSEYIENSEDIKEKYERGYYTPDVYKRKKLSNIAHTGVKIVKLYAPSSSVIILGIVCYMSSYGIIKKRNAALIAAYNTLDSAFKRYRDNVIAEQGIEFDEAAMKRSIDGTEYDEMAKDENPKKKIENEYSPYARIFDECSSEWVRNSEANLMTLRAREQWANQKLSEQGHLFLNEVYDMLDIKRSSIGAQVGWIYDPRIEHQISFGIYNIDNPQVRKFVNGYEYSIVLDFNCDGVIYDKI